jgi:putative transposase
VTVTCRVLKIARQPYYRWLACPIRDAELEEAYLAHAIFCAHEDDPEFGYRFLADEVRSGDTRVCDRTVWKICSENGWWSSFGKRTRGKKSADSNTPAHDDRVNRHFRAEETDTVWFGDITEHRTAEGKLYLCAIKDACSNKIVGYSIDERMKARLAVSAIENATLRRGDVAGCIFHTDRGSQFRSRKVHRALARHALVGSMGRVGSAADNAAMESFFALLQKNVLNRKRWATRDELRIAIVTWIERTYHRRRRQVALGGLTPVEFEMIMTQQTDRAA